MAYYAEDAASIYGGIQNQAAGYARARGLTRWNREEEERKNKLNEFGNYLSSGNYTTDNNQKFRDMATQAVADLDEQMKRYGKSSNEYKTLDSYKQYYSNALPNFDRMDVGANVKDYLSYDYENNKFNNWHSEEDYNTQKTYLDQQRAALQSEMDAIEDQTSADYLSLKSWQEQYDALAEALEERNAYDRQFADINDYTAYERSGDYKNTIQAKQTLQQAQEQLKDLEAQIKPLEMKFSGYTDLSAIAGADAAAYQQLADLRQQYAQQQKNVLELTSEVAGMEKWQKDAAVANYYMQYGEDADYQQILDDLIAARNKAQEGSEDWAKIDLQIRALAGENENGLNDNGQYDENTLYGRAVMRGFDTDAAQKRLEEIDQELKDLGVSTSRFWGGVTNAENNFGVDAAGMVYTDDTRVGESDPRVMELRAEKTELTRKLNSAAKFQEKDSAEQAFRNLSEAEHKALQEAGLQHISQKGNTYYRDIGFDSTQSNGQLDNFQYLDDEYGSGIRDMLIEALGAEALGKDIGYTVDDVLRLYEGDINHIAGMREAQKISDMDSDFLRWNRQVFGVGTAAGLNQFATGMRQAFSDDYIEPNKTAYKAQYTREDLKRYGNEQIANGSNISQMLFDTTQTTANMLPMIAASYLMTKAGLAPVAGEIVGATLMGLSSGGNTYQQALAEGWDKTDAKAYATILGAAEGTMQYLIGGISGLGGVGEEQLLKAAAGINNAAVRFATETGIHILSETTEELAQNRLQRYLDYKLGASDNPDWYSWDDDDWYTVIVTALSTGALEGPGTAINLSRSTRLGEQLSGQRAIPSRAANESAKARNATIAEIGKAMQSQEALRDTLLTIGTNVMEEGTDAYDLASRLASGKAAMNATNLGMLYSEIVSEYVQRNGSIGYDQATAAIIGGGIKFHELKTAGDAVTQAREQLAKVKEENPGADVLGLNETELVNRGATVTGAKEFAPIINKFFSGTELSKADTDKLLGDSSAANAAREIIASQSADPTAMQLIRLSLTRENAEGAREVLGRMSQLTRDAKKAKAEADKTAVAEAAVAAADQAEVSIAARNADRISASTLQNVGKAEADAAAAEARLNQVEKMSYEDAYAANRLGAKDTLVEAAIDEDLEAEKAALDKRAAELSAIRFPSKEQRTQLADVRERQAALANRMADEYQRTKTRVESEAAAEKARQEEAKKAAEKSTTFADTIVVPGTDKIQTREQFVQEFSQRLMDRNSNLVQAEAIAQANARFDELAATQKPKEEAKAETKKTESKTKVKPEKVKPNHREKLTGKVEYWQGGAVPGAGSTEYGAVTEAEAEQLLGKTELDFVKNVLSKVANVTLIKSLANDKGELIGANGIFFKDGRLYLDVNAGTEVGQRSIVLTAAHELTHFIRAYNNKAYGKLRDFVTAELVKNGQSLEALIKREQDNYAAANPGKELSRDKAIEEIVANSCETMLTDGEAIRRFAEQNPAEAKTILDWLTDFFQKISDAFNELVAVHPEAAAMQKNINALRDLWLDALVAADENAIKSTLDDHVQTEVNAEGEDVATTDDNGHGMFNLKTWRDGGRNALEVFLRKRVKSKALDQTQADEMLEQMDKLYKVCEEYDDGTYGPFSAWSNATVVMGKDGKPAFSVIKTNGEYKLNLDFSLVCKKRRALDAVFNEMIERGLMNKVVGDEMFLKMYPASIVQINNYIREAGFETACALCFVDTKRYLQAMKADEFCAIYNGLVNSLIEGTDRKAKYFNYGGDMEFFNTWNNRTGIETLPDFELNWKRIDEVLRTEKPTSTLYRMAEYIKNNPEGRKLAARGDFMSTNGIDAMTIDHARLLELFHAKQGNSNAKDVVSDTPYFNEVIKSGSFTKEKAYSVGGVRIQSFSDYVGRLVFDYIQMTADLAAKELPAHSYTKEYMFAMQFGKTGIKINMSLVPRVMEDGVAPGLDKDGNYAWMDGQSFGSTVYDNNNKRLTAQQGYELAIQIQNAEGYSKNCGTIAVGVSYDHIVKMLDDPNIRMIIPYHKSGINHLLAEMQQINQYEDYTKVQNTQMKNAKGEWVKLEGAPDFNWNDNLQRLEREGKGARECAQLYKAWCAEHGYLPKFNDFAWHPNYYKVLEDFTAYDKDGVTPAPLQGVQLNFPQEGDAFGSMQKLIQDGLQEDAVLQAKQDVGVKGIVDRIETELPAWEAEFKAKGDKFAIETSKASMAKTEMRDNEPMMSSRSAKNSEDEIKSLFDRDDLGLVDFEEKVDRWVADIPVGSVVEWGLPNNRRIATKKADGSFSVTAPDGNRNSVRATELREWLMNNVSHDLWAHDWDEVGVKVRDAGPSFSLRNLPYNVEPTSDRWKRDHTTAEVKKMYPSLWDITADESETRNPTQVRDTVKTYRKIYDLLKAEGFNGRILDASSGLGDGTKAGREEYGFEVDDIEPFPDKSYNPKYTDYDTLNEKYDAIISNAVLNVLPQDQRDALVVKMGELLNPGGKMYINVRGDDVNGNKSNQPIGGKWEYYVSSTGSYQKGFTKPELKAYLEDALGNGFTVDITNKFGKTAAIVTKTAEPSFSLRNGEEATVYIKDGHRADGSTVDFINEILDGRKLGETRNHNRMTYGKWVGIGKDGQVLGRVKFGKPYQISRNSPEYADAMIDGTEYDLKDGETKWYYPVVEKEDFRNNPKPITRNGNYGVYQVDGKSVTPEEAQASFSSRDAQYNNWAPEFYSKMANTIDEWTNGKGQPLGAKMAANQVVGWLKGKGVKSEEIKWSGIIPYLEGKKTVTKEELQQVMAENEIKIETKVLGGDSYVATLDWDDISLDGEEDIRELAWEKLEQDAKEYGYEDMLYDENGKLREDLIELAPHHNGTIIATNSETGEIILEARPSPGKGTHWGEYTLYGGRNYQEILFKQPGLGYSNEAMRVHWGDKDVIAHARVQDMLDRWGNRVLFVEEIQSDLHNAGARLGFNDQGRDLLRKYEEAKQAYKEASDNFEKNEKRRALDLAEELYPRWRKETKIPDYQAATVNLFSLANWIINFVSVVDEDFNSSLQVDRELMRIITPSEAEDIANIRDSQAKVKELEAEKRRLGSESFNRRAKAPDVPFAGSSDTYHEYVMKHMLRLAAEGDYAAIGWTTAAQQSDRWSDEYEEGYKIEYDQNIPKFMNKYGKQWGAKVGSTVLENDEEVWSVPITEEMKRSVLETGQPLFSSRDTNAPDNQSPNPYQEGTLQYDILEHTRKGDLYEWMREQKDAYDKARENAKERPPVIPARGFVPQVTPAEKTAIENRRQYLIQKKGAMKPSEKNATGYSMPKQDEKGRGFNRFMQNVLTAKQTTPAHEQAKKFAFTDVAATHAIDSNKADLKWANDLIHEDGRESAIKQFNRAAIAMDNSQHNITKNLALGQQLLIETSRAGDMQEFLDVLSSLCLLSSQAGKSLQAFRMLKQSGPIGELYYVQKSVKQLNDRNAAKIQAGKMDTITIPEDLANEVLMATTEEEQDKAVDNLIAAIGKQVPVTLMDKWNAWRYLAMLGNARTHVRNFIGNAVFTPLRFAKDLMAAGGEFVLTKAGLMDETDRRKAVTVSRELRDFAKQDAKAMEKELRGNGKYNPMREILDSRQILPGFLEALSRKNGELLEYEDWLFLSPAYQRALTQALAHSGYTLDQMLSGEDQEAVKALNRARVIAVNEAQKATYRDFNAAAAMLNRIKRMETGKGSDKILGVLLEGILPFTKTPINILRRGVEYSPIGIATSIFEAANKAKNGEFDMAEFIDHLSAGLTGSAVVVLGYLLSSLGYLRNKKDDKEEEFEKLQGYQDYSLQIGDVSATIDWAAPTALPLFTGGALYQLTHGEDLELKDAWDAMMMIAEPMMSLSMLDGLNNVLSSASYAEDSQKLATVASSAFTSYLGQAFPTLAGQLARSMDGTRRSTYVDKNSPVPSAIQRFVQSSIQNKTPIWEEQKIPYIDQWGREDSVNSKALGALENFISPSYINIVHTTDVDEELRTLYDATKDSSVLPSTAAKYFSVGGEQKDLTADEYVSYAKDIGQTKYTLLTQLFSDPRYMRLTDEQKAKAINDYIYKYANTAGKYHVDNEYQVKEKWIREAEAAATDYQRFEIIWKKIEDGIKD